MGIAEPPGDAFQNKYALNFAQAQLSTVPTGPCLFLHALESVFGSHGNVKPLPTANSDFV